MKISNQFIQNGQQVGASGANAAKGENWSTELQKAIDAVVLANAAKAGTTAAAGTSGSTTVNVNIAGRNTPVNVVSQADANNLTSILRQLETGLSTAA